jgi:hypothetical protein
MHLLPPLLLLLLLCQALDYTAAFTAAVAGLSAFNAQGALAACSSSGEPTHACVVFQTAAWLL